MMDSLNETDREDMEEVQANSSSQMENQISEISKSIHSLSSTILGMDTKIQQKIGTLENQMFTLQTGMSEIQHPDPEVRFNLRPQLERSSSEQNRNTNQNMSEQNGGLKVKPQQYDGTTDIGDYLTQFNIIAEINGWSNMYSALYLASSLSGNARSLLSELSELEKRDFHKLTEILRSRFGTRNKAEIFRTQLKSLCKEPGQSISDLAQKVKKLTRQAYPDANAELIEVLALDYFIDSLDDSDIRLRLRECCPKSVTDAETIAVRLETHKLADKQRMKPINAYQQAPVSTSTVQKPREEIVTPSMNDLVEQIKSLSQQVEKINASGQAGRDLRPQNGYQNVQNNRYRSNGQNFQDHRYNSNFQGRQSQQNQLNRSSNNYNKQDSYRSNNAQGRSWQGNGARSSWGTTARPRTN